jgi:anthranilate synthase component 2
MIDMKILLLDNYDSFTFNLLHLVEQFDGVEVDVFRNDEIDLDEVQAYDKIILSPGPGLPADAGITLELIKRFHVTKSILGICLGHQAIALAFGGKLFNLATVQHGVSVQTTVTDQSEKLFKNIPAAFKTGRYHSWVVDKEQFPGCLRITAMDQKQNIMALRHSLFDVSGVQFHPESILSEYGKTLIGNWLSS